MARERIQIKAPDGKRWKKTSALFDEGSAEEYINPELLKRLGAKIDHSRGAATLHVKVLGEVYSWPFHASDLKWKELRADVIFGREFMGINGVVLIPTPKGMKIGYAPGYPQGPVI